MSLPADILLHIVKIYTDFDFHHGLHFNNKLLMRVVSVCREWRDICEQHSGLWGHWSLWTDKAEPKFQFSLENARLWLTLPKSTTPRIVLTVWTSSSALSRANAKKLCQFLVDHQDRIGTLAIHYYPGQTGDTGGWLGPSSEWPVLEVLYVNIHGPETANTMNLSPFLMVGQAPWLQILEIRAQEHDPFSLHEEMEFPMVKALRLGPCADRDLGDALTFLQAFPDLETLEIAWWQAPWMQDGICSREVELTMRTLRQLDVECDGVYPVVTEIFHCCLLPTLQHLSLSFISVDPFYTSDRDEDPRPDECSQAISDLTYLKDLFDASNCGATLRSLNLVFKSTHACSNATLGHLISSLHSLLELVLDMPCFGYRPLRTSLGSQLATLHLRCTQPRRPLLRNLIKTVITLIKTQTHLQSFEVVIDQDESHLPFRRLLKKVRQASP